MPQSSPLRLLPLFALTALALTACSSAESTDSSRVIDLDPVIGHRPPPVYCPAVDPDASIIDYRDPGDYYAKLTQAGFACASPHMVMIGETSTTEWTYLDYAVCLDTPDLRAFVGLSDPTAEQLFDAGIPFVEDGVCTAVLPRAQAGRVYVMWTPSNARWGNHEHCAGGCLLPKLEPDPGP